MNCAPNKSNDLKHWGKKVDPECFFGRENISRWPCQWFSSPCKEPHGTHLALLCVYGDWC